MGTQTYQRVLGEPLTRASAPSSSEAVQRASHAVFFVSSQLGRDTVLVVQEPLGNELVGIGVFASTVD